jgi:HlyD family secretion protein
MEASVRQAREAAKGLELFEKVELPLALKDADMDVQRILDTMDDQREELDQLEKMYKSEELTNATAEIVVKRAKRTLDRTLVQLDMTRTRSAKTKEHDLPAQLERHKASAEEAAHSLEVLQKTGRYSRAEKEAGVVRAQLELAQQQRAKEKLKVDKEALSVRASMDGTVYYGSIDAGKWSGTAEASKSLRVGEKVQANQILMTVVGAGLDVHVGVKEADLYLYAAGLETHVVPTGFPSLSWAGKTADAAPIAGSDGTFDALIKVGVADAPIVAGMKVKVFVRVADLKNVLLLPVGALQDEDGGKWVMLKGASTSSAVKVGKSDGKLVEILEGVKEGDEVVPPKAP